MTQRDTSGFFPQNNLLCNLNSPGVLSEIPTGFVLELRSSIHLRGFSEFAHQLSLELLQALPRFLQEILVKIVQKFILLIHQKLLLESFHKLLLGILRKLLQKITRSFFWSFSHAFHSECSKGIFCELSRSSFGKSFSSANHQKLLLGALLGF